MRAQNREGREAAQLLASVLGQGVGAFEQLLHMRHVAHEGAVFFGCLAGGGVREQHLDLRGRRVTIVGQLFQGSLLGYERCVVRGAAGGQRLRVGDERRWRTARRSS